SAVSKSLCTTRKSSAGRDFADAVRAAKNIFFAVCTNENKQLQDQLRELVDENGRLYKLVKERDFEIRQLRKKIEEDRFALSGTSGLAGDIAATKIVELSKKNRELTAETESEKTKVKQLNNKVKELEKEVRGVTRCGPPSRSAGGCGGKGSFPPAVSGAEPESPEVKALQDKLSAANFKAMEHRNQLQATKQELKTTQKLLASEVGEDVNIHNLLATVGSWRGRAQQILVLQGKVRELENQLAQSKGRASANTLDEEMLSLTDAKKLTAQERNLLRIRSLEREKKEALEKLTVEHEALQKEHEEVKKKLDASKSRNRVLSGEVKSLKEQILTLLDKGKHDDELIDALLSQQKEMQEILKHLSQQEERNKESQQSLGQQFNLEAQKQNCLVEQLKQMVAEREARLKELEEEIGWLTCKVRRVLETVSKMGHMLVESAATKSIPVSLSLLSSPVRISEPNGPDLKAQQAQITEHKALCQANEVERDRLVELVTKVLEAEKKLQEQRRRSVILEQQLEKLKLENGKPTGTQKLTSRTKAGEADSRDTYRHWTASDRKDPSPAQLSEVPLETQLEELNTRLLIYLDENEVLKTSLRSTVKLKEEDFRLYQETMGQVKKIFLQALRQQKQEKN
uniref:Coiled-coil domain containing 13 n=1 Tax=Sphenodon punctatus TaxID=8508 RepID=A0A8D0G1D0_SPHPU